MRSLIRPLVFGMGLSFAVPSLAFADELDDLGKSIEQNPDDGKLYDAYANAAFKQKKWDEAIRKLKVGVARVADYKEGYYKLAYAYRQKREWADAADYYRRVLAIDGTRLDCYYGLGASLQGLGDTKGAIAAYDKYVALEKAPAKQRFVDSAKAELIKLDPSRAPKEVPPPAPAAAKVDVAQLRADGDAAKKAGKLDEAKAAYEKILEVDPNNVEALNELGNVMFGLKKYDEAAKVFAQAVKRDPKFSLGWYNLAHAYRKLDKKADAANAYKTYIKLKPEDPDPYYGLGQSLKGLGEVNEAIEAFKTYIKMEKRPEEQKWVDKAKAELEALEAMVKKPPVGPATSSKVEEKSIGTPSFAPGSIDQDGLLDPFNGRENGGVRLNDLHDPWYRPDPSDQDGLLMPSNGLNQKSSAPVPAGPLSLKRKKIRAYGDAIAAYRRALSRQAETVSAGYERGASFAMLDDVDNAVRAWATVRTSDVKVDEARRSVEKLRADLGR